MKGCTSYFSFILYPFLPRCSAQENSSLTTQVASLKQSLQESQEQTGRLRSELHKVKGAAKSPVGDGRVSELEGRLRMTEEENMSLQVHVYTQQCILYNVCVFPIVRGYTMSCNNISI